MHATILRFIQKESPFQLFNQSSYLESSNSEQFSVLYKSAFITRQEHHKNLDVIRSFHHLSIIFSPSSFLQKMYIILILFSNQAFQVNTNPLSKVILA